MYILIIVSVLKAAAITVTTYYSAMPLVTCIEIQSKLVELAQTAEFKRDADMQYAQCVPEEAI